MKIGFIGAGKVGTTFGLYLKQTGLDIHGYYSRTWEQACQSAEITGSKAERDVKAILTESKIVFITI